jgi:hypothetical protein
MRIVPNLAYPLDQNRKVREAKLASGAAMCAAEIQSGL